MARLAKENMPNLLETEMADYMGTVGKPDIQDVEVIYQCDSLCVLQAKVSGKDTSGAVQKETIRYFFIKDTFASAVFGLPEYCHSVTGAPYLDKKGIEEFCKEITAEPYKTYLYHLAKGRKIPMHND